MTEIIGKVKTHTSAYKARCYLCAGVIDALAPHTLTYLERGDAFYDDEDDDEAWDMWSVHSHHACEALLDLAPDIIPEDDSGAYERPCQDLVYIYLDTLQDPRGLLERVEDERHRAWLLARYERLVALASGQMNLF